jgi:hypothetical protein
MFTYAICGDSEVEKLNYSLKFLKHFSREDIIVIAARCNHYINHDQILSVVPPTTYDNKESAIFLKTNILRILGPVPRVSCYIDSDVIAVSKDVDGILALKNGPIRFAADHTRMRTFSRYAINCGCYNSECDHLREAIATKFNLEITEPDWQHWNGGVFLFDNESVDFLDTWCKYSSNAFSDPRWKKRDQGTLIAAAWTHGLQSNHPLPRRYNYIVDPLRERSDADRLDVRPGSYSVDNSYSLQQNDGPSTPYLVHFINNSVGVEGWKNWDDAVAKLAYSLSAARS